MTNNVSGKAVELDRLRHLRYTANDLIDAEEVLRAGLPGLLMDPNFGGFRLIRALLYVGLRHEDPGLTLAKTGDIIDALYKKGLRFGEINQIIGEAMIEQGWGVSIPSPGSEEVSTPL